MQKIIDQDDVLVIAALTHYASIQDHDILREHCHSLAGDLADRNCIDTIEAEEHLHYDIAGKAQ